MFQSILKGLFALPVRAKLLLKKKEAQRRGRIYLSLRILLSSNDNFFERTIVLLSFIFVVRPLFNIKHYTTSILLLSLLIYIRL
jgi:hypothetical protein